MIIRLPEPDALTTRLVIAPVEHETTSLKPTRPFTEQVQPPSSIGLVPRKDSPLEEQLFDNRASLKILTSRISMHLDSSTRSDLFRQIDELLDPKAWDDDNSLIRESSFATLLRFIASKQKLRRPALSVSSDGNIMASWINDACRLTIEFRASEAIKMVVHRTSEQTGKESIAFAGSLRTLDAVLEPFNAVGTYRETT